MKPDLLASGTLSGLAKCQSPGRTEEEERKATIFTASIISKDKEGERFKESRTNRIGGLTFEIRIEGFIPTDTDLRSAILARK